MISAKNIPKEHLKFIHDAYHRLILSTANGNLDADKEVPIKSGSLKSLIEALLLPNTPPVLSVGKLVVEHGYTFYWVPGYAPVVIDPDGMGFELEVRIGVPYLSENDVVKRPMNTPGLSIRSRRLFRFIRPAPTTTSQAATWS